MVNKFRLLFFLSTPKKGTDLQPSHSTAANCCSKDVLDSDNDQQEEELVAGRISVKEYLRPSERLVFEPVGSTRSILEAAKVPFPDCVVVAVETGDPRADFRASMEEMVEELRLDGAEQLAGLLAWYLRMNVKENRCYIVEAFVDMFTASSVLASNTSTPRLMGWAG
ncbi:unnamed protein product [Linum tenue]|uniref:Transcription repressor n=1 Tax=Linum tenue TaxID=586396 RepID=A0AAV0QEW2_9ROSI|nr:unnamed protein product [Linum tenue]